VFPAKKTFGSMNNETLIIGAGPAGSAAAIQLAMHGIPVRLLERQTGPHHKVCGEFISYEAAHYLEHLGVNLPALGAKPVHQVRFYNGESELEFELPFTAWSLSRRTLDAALLDQAQEAGATVAQGRVVTHLSRAADGWEITTRDRSTAVSARLSARTIFLATGKHELRNWKRNIQASRQQNFIGFKMHFSPSLLVQAQWQGAVEIHLFDGGYAGLEPIEGGDLNLCFLIRQEIYKACGSNWPALLDWLACRSPHLRQRLANLTPCWNEPLAISGVPYGYIDSSRNAVPGLFRLGDQAAVIPSFAGDGIAIALHTAVLAAQIHAAGGDAKMYQQRAYQDLTRPVRNATWLAQLLSHPGGRKAAFACARLWPKLLTTMIRRTRVR
jgi:flavin-dependent dehydrogenase